VRPTRLADVHNPNSECTPYPATAAPASLAAAAVGLSLALAIVREGRAKGVGCQNSDRHPRMRWFAGETEFSAPIGIDGAGEAEYRPAINEATAQRCGRGRRVAPRQLHLPKQAFRGHGSFQNVATAQVLLNVALARTPTRHSSPSRCPGTSSRGGRSGCSPARRRGCRCPRQCRFAGETEFRHRTRLQRDRVSEPTLLAPRPSARRGGRTTGGP
jgi:hypothetical protein